MKINGHLLETDLEDHWNLTINESPNTKPDLILTPQKIIIATTYHTSIERAIKDYTKTGWHSYHLILGKNGKDVVQLVPFNIQTKSAPNFKFEADAIVISLDYQSNVIAGSEAYIDRLAGKKQVFSQLNS